MAIHPLNIISLCSGVGMLDEGLRAGLEAIGIESQVVLHVEREIAAACQLATLMEAGCLDAAPIWDDLTTLDCRPWRGVVDGVVAGFPCQPHSVAGQQKGIDDDRWIWPDIARIIRETESSFAFLENVPGLFHGAGIEHVMADLAAIGFNAEWCHIEASAVGAAHKRERIFILAFHPGRGRRILRESSGRLRFPDGHNETMGNSTGARPSARQNAGTNLSDAREDRSRSLEPERTNLAMGNTGLQHVKLQQREIRPEPASADIVVDDASSQRRQQIAGGTHGDETTHERRSTPYHNEPQCSDKDVEHSTIKHGGQRTQGGGNNDDEKRWQDSDGHAGLEGRELFAPGPLDPRWARIIADAPYLAPATEPGVLLLAHGMAYLVDESRTNQLREIGNGVVALQAAVAFVGLVRRINGGQIA